MKIKKAILWLLKNSMFKPLFKAKPNKESNQFIKQIYKYKP